MKYLISRGLAFGAESLPSRGARVEIQEQEEHRAAVSGRSPRGERGLKSHQYFRPHLLRLVAPLAGSEG